jgi:citrate lyase beta subunit
VKFEGEILHHFSYLSDSERDRLFYRPPQPFDAGCDPALLAVTLGATLYSPATRPNLAVDITKNAAHVVISAVACLEDAVADHQLSQAERNLVNQLRELRRNVADQSLMFVRIRAAEQIPMLIDRLGAAEHVLTGFVLPKFSARTGVEFLDAVTSASKSVGRRLWAMPVLETPELIHAERRVHSLLEVQRLLDTYRSNVLAVRIGATDMSSTFGLRRSREVTVYDVRVVANAIADVVNVLGRHPTGYTVTGPVWEYFNATQRRSQPQRRKPPVVDHNERALDARLFAQCLDALIREVRLDQANGLVGKTVIHPSHVAAVHALSVITREDYDDATDILRTANGGGVTSSVYRNKMNESKPHNAWAQRTMLRASAFGVIHDDVSFIDLLRSGLPSKQHRVVRSRAESTVSRSGQRAEVT